MSGKITDENGPLAGASIVATHVPSGTVYYSAADNSGNFRIPNIQAGGPYSVKITMLGFRDYEVTDINVALGDNYVLKVLMQEETVSLNAIVVSAESSSSSMRSDRAGAVTSVGVREISDIPTVSRSVNDILKLTPQASSSGKEIGGGNYRQSFVTVDGAAFNNAFGIGQNIPANGSPISIDAVEQISVNIAPYDVRQSGFIGASINAITRSGSNRFEGSAYTYFNNQDMKGVRIGKDYTLTRSDSQYLMYGGRVGGPIIKDKLFFFLNVEIEKSVEPGPSRVPSGYDGKVYSDGSDGVARPTQAILDKVSNYLKSNYNYDPGAYMGYSADSPGFKILGRIDWNINRDNKLSVRYSNTKSKYPSGPSTSTSGLADRGFTTNSRTSMTAVYFQNARYFQEQNFSSMAAELNSRLLEGRLNNVLRLSYSHQYEPRSTQGGEFPFVDIVVGGNTYTSFGTELFSYGNLRDVRTYNVTDELSFSKGIHNFLAGASFEFDNTRNGFQRFGRGYYTFTFDTEEELDAALDNGTVFDSPYQFAITHSNRSDFSQVFPSFDYEQLSFYAQDEMSISDNFRLTAGLRIELPMYPELTGWNERLAAISFASVDASERAEGITRNYSTTQLPSTKVMWSPRIGFNWDISGDRSVVMRGGTGLFTGRVPFVWIVSLAGDSGTLQTTVAKTSDIPKFPSDESENTRKYLLDQLYPDGFTEGSSTIGSSCTFIDKDFKMPQTWKTSLAIDFKLPWNMTASIEGIYNKDINPAYVFNADLKNPVSTNNLTSDNRLIYGGKYLSSGDGGATFYGAYVLTNADIAGYYYSLTCKLEKKFSKGFSGMVAFTHSRAKSLNDGIGDQISSAWSTLATVNGANHQELGYAGYVTPERLISSLSYSFDWLRHFGTGVSIFYEGGPQGRFSYTYTAAVLGDGGSSSGTLIYVPHNKDELQFKDYTPSGWSEVYTAEEQADDFWNYINQDAYLRTRKGQFAERNGGVYPWINQIDVKIHQNFYLNVAQRRNTIQLGFDILNLGNLLNSSWGNYYYVQKTNILKVVSGYSQGSTEAPAYQFQANGTEILKKTFTTSKSFSSTWSMQVSLRYIF
ncbi:MAG: carboxypeptidase regulatory-like domain-containing protein [Bacteroidales bacterium]|jgi:hypothetical protein|nr:carboxypeptidase regulatory-like domain-containing protein [Bacteroidales bacterium]